MGGVGKEDLVRLICGVDIMQGGTFRAGRGWNRTGVVGLVGVAI